MYTYDDYEDEVTNESALDMAMDMSDRYGIAVEDAYAFACDAMEGSLKDPEKRKMREEGRRDAAIDEYREAERSYKNATSKNYSSPKARAYAERKASERMGRAINSDYDTCDRTNRVLNPDRSRAADTIAKMRKQYEDRYGTYDAQADINSAARRRFGKDYQISEYTDNSGRRIPGYRRTR